MPYERLLREAQKNSIEVYEKPMTPSIKGLYGDNTVWVNSGIPTIAEKSCILAEELGHHYTSSGDILDQKELRNRKQEKRARNWAYERLVPLDGIVQAYKAGVSNRYEIAEFMNVTEDFLDTAIRHYSEKYGLFASNECYLIYFEPLMVVEMFEFRKGGSVDGVFP